MAELYGLTIPEGQHIAGFELNVWRNYDALLAQGAKLMPKHMHMKEAILAMYPEEFTVNAGTHSYKQRGYVWNKWMEVRNENFCGSDRDGTKNFQTWWGASATGKSTDAGVLGLMMWLASPHNTTVIVMSTTKDALEQRIWREVVKFYRLLDDHLPGTLVPSKTAIYYDRTGDTLSGIHGFAVQKGTIQDSLGNIIGRHNTNMYVIIDEMQATREAAVEAWDNLSSGCEDCRFLGMGNPASKLDPLGSKSIPVGGWDKLSADKTEWLTPFGKTLYFDGLKSPGVDDPVKYPFLLTQQQIDKMKRDPGEDSPRYWTMRRGFLPPDGLVWAVLTEGMIAQYHVCDRVVWKTAPTRVCGIDPAYSTDGDKCILYPAFAGETVEGKFVIQFDKEIRIPIVAKAGKNAKSVLDDLTDKIASQLLALGCAVQHCGMDTTGNQWMLADAVESKMQQQGMCRVSFSGSASGDTISQQDARKGSELYSNRVTELWARFGVYIKNDMIRGLGTEACKQFCVRLIDFAKGDTRRVKIESKTLLRERLGFSPDEADSAVIVLEVVRTVLGVIPELFKEAGGATTGSKTLEYLAKQEDDMWDDEGFEDGDVEAFGEFDDGEFL